MILVFFPKNVIFNQALGHEWKDLQKIYYDAFFLCEKMNYFYFNRKYFWSWRLDDIWCSYKSNSIVLSLIKLYE